MNPERTRFERIAALAMSFNLFCCALPAAFISLSLYFSRPNDVVGPGFVESWLLLPTALLSARFWLVARGFGRAETDWKLWTVSTLLFALAFGITVVAIMDGEWLRLVRHFHSQVVVAAELTSLEAHTFTDLLFQGWIWYGVPIGFALSVASVLRGWIVWRRKQASAAV